MGYFWTEPDAGIARMAVHLAEPFFMLVQAPVAPLAVRELSRMFVDPWAADDGRLFGSEWLRVGANTAVVSEAQLLTYVMSRVVSVSRAGVPERHALC